MSTRSQNFVKSPVKIPPQDIQAEQALLGSILIKPKSFNEIVDYISENDLYANKHRLVFRGMKALYDKNEPIDVVSLTAWLKAAKLLEQSGGSSYLAELVNSVPTASHLKSYADIVSKKSSLRKLIESADSILELGYDENQDINEVFDKAERIIFGLANFSKKTFVSIKDTLNDAWERFDNLNKSDESIRGVPTGFRELDNLLSGFQKSDLVILAARPSIGKTSLALDILRNAACRHGIPAALFSLEMSVQQVVDRIIAAESRVDSWKLRTGKVAADDEFSRIRDALDSLAQAPIFIDDEPSNNITNMKAVARRLKSENNLSLIVVDYLQLMKPTHHTDSMVQQVTDISRSLKALARELDVPVIALSQLSRAVETRGGRPRLSDLRDSGSIEQDADVVMFIHREDKHSEDEDKRNVAEIMVEKHRNGPVGKVDLYFDEKRVSFVSIEKGDFGSF